MIDHRQSRAARSLLGWNQQELAEKAGVALATVQFFESNKREPIPNNLTAMRCALEEAGVEFIPAKNGKGVGVRLRDDLRDDK
jgi:transcriptional regulator with XRE-family HTH domain